MKSPKVKDTKLFNATKKFLTVYLVQIRSRSTHTIQSYRDTINLFEAFLEETKGIELEQITASEFNQGNIVKFLEWLEKERGCVETTRNQRLVCIRAFSRFLSREKVIDVADYAEIEEIETLKVADRTVSEILSIEQVGNILRLPNKTTKFGKRDHFLIALLYDTGCRNDEIINLKYGDISVHKDGTGEVGIVGKGRKYRVTPITADVIVIFKEFADEIHPNRNPSSPLIPTLLSGTDKPMSPDNSARILEKYDKLARKADKALPHLHPHLFRHSRAMHLYQAGMPLSLVSEWLGHSQLETTLIYAYADTEMKRKAADKMREANETLFTREKFKYQDNKEVIKKLYGLA